MRTLRYIGPPPREYGTTITVPDAQVPHILAAGNFEDAPGATAPPAAPTPDEAVPPAVLATET